MQIASLLFAKEFTMSRRLLETLAEYFYLKLNDFFAFFIGLNTVQADSKRRATKEGGEERESRCGHGGEM